MSPFRPVCPSPLDSQSTRPVSTEIPRLLSAHNGAKSPIMVNNRKLGSPPASTTLSSVQFHSFYLTLGDTLGYVSAELPGIAGYEIPISYELIPNNWPSFQQSLIARMVRHQDEKGKKRTDLDKRVMRSNLQERRKLFFSS